jgi:hypothetical protein
LIADDGSRVQGKSEECGVAYINKGMTSEDPWAWEVEVETHGKKGWVCAGLYGEQNIHYLVSQPNSCGYSKSAAICTDSTIYNVYGWIPSTFVPRRNNLVFRFELFRGILTITQKWGTYKVVLDVKEGVYFPYLEVKGLHTISISKLERIELARSLEFGPAPPKPYSVISGNKTHAAASGLATKIPKKVPLAAKAKKPVVAGKPAAKKPVVANKPAAKKAAKLVATSTAPVD